MKKNLLEISIIGIFAFLVYYNFFTVDHSKAAIMIAASDRVIINLRPNQETNLYFNNVGINNGYDVTELVTQRKTIFDNYSSDRIDMKVIPTPKSYVVRAYPNGKEIIDRPLNIKNKFSKIQLECMARNIYYESRGQGRLGMQAVGYVTMNRVHSGEYPSSICGVVYQGERTKKGVLYKCQFSWVCDGTVKNIRSKKQWKLAKELAIEVANTYTPKLDPTKGSLFYHASYLKRPFRRMNVVEVVRINEHVFYKKRRA